MVTVSIFYIQFVVVQHVTIDGEQSRAILKVDLSYTFQLVVAICKRISWHDSQLKLILIYLVHPLSATGHTPSITKTHMLFVSWASCFVMGFFFYVASLEQTERIWPREEQKNKGSDTDYCHCSMFPWFQGNILCIHFRNCFTQVIFTHLEFMLVFRFRLWYNFTQCTFFDHIYHLVTDFVEKEANTVVLIH